MNETNKRLLFIVPEQQAYPTPVIDIITRKMCAAFRNAKPSNYAYGGVHSCYCGATSSDCDHYLQTGQLTNSLCVHYLAHHRAEIPQQQLNEIEQLSFGESDPIDRELLGPEFLHSGMRASVARRLGTDRLETWVAFGLDFPALCQGLLGGWIETKRTQTSASRDAHDLFNLLQAIPTEALPCVQAAALRSYGRLKAWGVDALRVPGFKRDAWLTPLSDILQLPEKLIPEKRVYSRLLEKIANGEPIY